MPLGEKKPNVMQSITESIDQSDMRKRIKVKDRGELQITTIRLHEKDMEVLKNHFGAMGMNLSTGIRTVLRSYMYREGIL